MLKTAEKRCFDKNVVESKMVFRARSSKGVDKNGAQCNMVYGRMTNFISQKTIFFQLKLFTIVLLLHQTMKASCCKAA